jgi:two-component system, NtrC family, sensor kinase
MQVNGGYRAALDGVREAVVLTDGSFSVRYLNGAAERVLGLSRAEAEGRPLAELVPGRYEGGVPDAGAEWSFATVDGGWAVYGRRELEPGGGEDMLRRMVEAEQLAAVGQLASSVAHEIGAPLTAISVAVEFLLKHECGGCSFASRDLEVILGQTRRIATLSKRLVDLARPGEPNFRELSLNDVVREAFELVERQLRRSAIDATLTLDPAAGRVRGDRDQLQQVVINLLLNAQRAMAGRGTGAVELCTERRGREVAIVVRDNGPGIGAEDLGRIFLPFYSRSGGTGLGLPLARQIVHAHGGTIQVESAAGQGATFRVHLPVERHD